MTRLLGLFAKAPIAGQVKTRLCPPLTPEAAADCYEAMLRDVVEQTRVSSQSAGFARALWFTPAESRDWFESLAGDFELHLQRGETLGQRMQAFFAHHAAAGSSHMLLRGTDSPTLPAELIQRALSQLDDFSLVISPGLDGGYNLIGLREPRPELFDFEMSTADVLEQTLQRAHALGLSVAKLSAHADVDRISDLLRLELGAHTPHLSGWLARARDSIRA